MDYFISFLIALGVIVFVHELGHHVVARLCGVRVLVFSLGFGKRLWGFEHNGTDYRISAVPLGGYVRMSGELPEDSSGDPGDFLNKPRWQRILIYLAGPAMNVVLSIGLITVLFSYGIFNQALYEKGSTVVGFVAEGSAGEEAGLQTDDRIVQVGRNKVDKWSDLSFEIGTSANKVTRVVIERDGEPLALSLTPTPDPKYGYGEAGIAPKLKVRMISILEDEPAAQAGFQPGDQVLSVDGEKVDRLQDFIAYVKERADVEIAIGVLREGQEKTISVTPQVIPGDEEGNARIGVNLGYHRELPFFEALTTSAEFNYDIVRQSMVIIGKLFTRDVPVKSSLSGPIEIAVISGEAARRGIDDYLFMMGFLSISIGFMNLLPIPVLDGGHIMILLIESTIRQDLSMVVKERITQVGFMMLMTLMAVVIFFDIAKNLPNLIPGS